jgi:predicted nucleotidyltransferase
MQSLLEQHRAALTELCRRFGARRLDVFGSDARGELTASSDLDFLVEFLSHDSPTIADQWFGLQESLQETLGRPVDLTSVRTAKNPHFLELANGDRISLYAA